MLVASSTTNRLRYQGWAREHRVWCWCLPRNDSTTEQKYILNIETLRNGFYDAIYKILPIPLRYNRSETPHWLMGEFTKEKKVGDGYCSTRGGDVVKPFGGFETKWKEATEQHAARRAGMKRYLLPKHECNMHCTVLLEEDKSW